MLWVLSPIVEARHFCDARTRFPGIGEAALALGSMKIAALEQGPLVEVILGQAAKLAGKYRADFYDLLKKHDLKVDEFKRVKPSYQH